MAFTLFIVIIDVIVNFIIIKLTNADKNAKCFMQTKIYLPITANKDNFLAKIYSLRSCVLLLPTYYVAALPSHKTQESSIFEI